MRFPPPIFDRLENNKREVNGCWEWTGNRGREGYGTISFQGKVWRVHRLSWKLKNGIDPIGMVLHKCDNPCCFNPEHLYIGDHKKNAADAVARGRLHAQKITHCPKGHEYVKSTTRIYRGKRICRICDVLRKRIKKETVWKQ